MQWLWRWCIFRRGIPLLDRLPAREWVRELLCSQMYLSLPLAFGILHAYVGENAHYALHSSLSIFLRNSLPLLCLLLHISQRAANSLKFATANAAAAPIRILFLGFCKRVNLARVFSFSLPSFLIPSSYLSIYLSISLFLSSYLSIYIFSFFFISSLQPINQQASKPIIILAHLNLSSILNKKENNYHRKLNYSCVIQYQIEGLITTK